MTKIITIWKITLIAPQSSAPYPSIIVSITQVIVPPKKQNKLKYQTSDLDALPEKTAYFWKQVFIDVWKSINNFIKIL